MSSVTIIGGADGPTAIFLAGKSDLPALVLAAVVIVGAAVVLWRIFSRKK